VDFHGSLDILEIAGSVRAHCGEYMAKGDLEIAKCKRRGAASQHASDGDRH
jgi:hypothetical protein